MPEKIATGMDFKCSCYREQCIPSYPDLTIVCWVHAVYMLYSTSNTCAVTMSKERSKRRQGT